MADDILYIFYVVVLFIVLGCFAAALIMLLEAKRLITQKGGVRNAYLAEKTCTQYVQINGISHELIAVVVCSEDPRFFEHKGYDIKGILHAAKKDFCAKKIIAGGSTITQQLCKNIFLTRERTLKRKILELIISIKMEKELNKQEILEWYFNILYFTESVVGIISISEMLFQKKPCQIGVREAIVIAGALPCPRLRLPDKELYHYGFQKCVRACFIYGKLFDEDDLDALKAMADRNDHVMEEKYGAVTRHYCESKGILPDFYTTSN